MSRYLEYLRPVLLFVGLAILVPAAYAYALGEDIWKLFLLTAVLLLAPGLRDAAVSVGRLAEHLWRVLIRKERQFAWNMAPARVPHAASLSQGDAIVVAALAWILIPLL
ncbi:MAG: hypothetical protein Q8P02_00560, partial [Candidatus Micrarchaeota archaeon]|nr:hypothetical protein [Candidatus Micrarchaeota archaeon]